MAESTESTLEEASRCPKCGTPGELGKEEPAPRGANLPRGTKILTYYCRNQLCRWFDTACRLIQVNPDGSIPPPKNHTGEPKLYVGRPDDKELSEQILRGLQGQLQAETEPGAEVRNRGGR